MLAKVFGQPAPAQRQREAERKNMEKVLLLLHKIGGAFVNLIAGNLVFKSSRKTHELKLKLGLISQFL